VHDFLPFIIAGMASGAVYGMAGTGLVLTYKTTGIFNFGQGAIATVAAYLFYYLHVRHDIGWLVSAVISVVGVGLILGLFMEKIGRDLARRSINLQVVGTVGIVVLVSSLAVIWYGPLTRPVAPFLPSATHTVRVASVNVSYQQITIAAISCVAVGSLYVFFRTTQSGLAMRAVVDNAELVGLHGSSAVAIRRKAWIIGTLFAALSGVLLVPVIGLDPLLLTYLIVEAFAAAAFGAFTNIAATFFGGVVLGVAINVAQKLVVEHSALNGIPQSLPFTILILALLILPKRRLVSPTLFVTRPPLQWRVPVLGQSVFGVVLLTLLALVPLMVGFKLTFFTTGLTFAILYLAIGLLVRTAGQVSLCQTAFAAVGVVAFSQLTTNVHIGWAVSLLISILITMVVGVLLALPAIRLSGLFLALATLAFGIAIERLVYPLGIFFTPSNVGKVVPRPSFANSDHAYYYLVLGFLVLTATIVIALHQSRLGRLLRGLSDSPLALSTLGLGVNLTRTIVFAISAGLAALAGVLYGGLVHYAAANDAYYSSFASLILIASLALAPFGEPWYGVFGIVRAIVPAYVVSVNTNNWLNVAFGVFAIMLATQGGTPGFPPLIRRTLGHLSWSRPERAVTSVHTEPTSDAKVRRQTLSPALSVRSVVVRYGGMEAVRGATLSGQGGQITGLIGPNGAGKTSIFNACSGLTRIADGSVWLGDIELSRMDPSARARAGLGRSFQRIELCETLSVADNVALGRECGVAGTNVLGQFVGSRRGSRQIKAAAAYAMDLCGITHLARTQVTTLSTGQRRLVELARVVAGDFDFLLLDEPSAGLDRQETAALGSVLQHIVNSQHCGILLVEHDMSLVMNTCSRIYVLDFGAIVFEGNATELASSPEVRAAYLGEDLLLPGAPVTTLEH